MKKVLISNEADFINAVNSYEEFTFEFDGLLYYVCEGAEEPYFYDIYNLDCDVQESREEYRDEDILDGGMWENEDVRGMFDFITSDNEHLKCL